MDIAYTYEVVAVDEAARVMEVLYRADGFSEMRVSMRIPFAGETLESVVDACSPVPYWQSLILPISVPSVGTTGTIAPTQQVEGGSSNPSSVDSVMAHGDADVSGVQTL